MNVNLAKYANKKICVAVSGGRDSMALLHYMHAHAHEYGIILCALNCDHRIRGEASARDSAFVKNWCKENAIPLLNFVWKDYEIEKKIGLATEERARNWRRGCYYKAMKAQTLDDGTKWQGADAVATAHHLNDNAETVLFNLARGSGLAGLKGIADSRHYRGVTDENLNLIRPLICCTREEIDIYINENNIPYVEDESNFTDDYTRNKIRHNVLPELERAVPGAARAIYRFSRLAAEDEEYFDGLIEERRLIRRTPFGVEVAFCREKVIFKRAAVKVFEQWRLKDYSSEHLQKLYDLQFAENGKKFEFLSVVAFKEGDRIALCDKLTLYEAENGCLLCDYECECGFYAGQFCQIVPIEDLNNEIEFVKNHSQHELFPEILKILKFDLDAVPSGAVVRFMKNGDKFTKFGGGTKSLGDYFTDKKIPVRLRKKIPLIAVGSEVLAVCGVEISDKIKITEKTQKVECIICTDYTKA